MSAAFHTITTLKAAQKGLCTMMFTEGNEFKNVQIF